MTNNFLTPGFLYFNFRSGCRAEMINSALASLVQDYSCVKNNFNNLGLSIFDIKIKTQKYNNISGQQIQIFINNKLICPQDNKNKFCFSPNIKPAQAKWHPSNADFEQPKKESKNIISNLNLSNSPVINSCLLGEDINLSSLREFFISSKINPHFLGLVSQIFDNLEAPIFTEHKISATDALWLVGHIIIFCSLIEFLQPKYISATPIFCSGFKYSSNKITNLVSLDNSNWLNFALQDIPSVEQKEPKDLDILGVALAKSVVGDFGPRGASIIKKIGFGQSSRTLNLGQSMVEALWCEADLPASMQEVGSNKKINFNFNFSISGLVSQYSNINKLIHNLKIKNAQNIYYLPVVSTDGPGYNWVSFISTEENKLELIKEFLLESKSENLHISPVEQHSLAKRIASVPLGKNNKITHVRVWEYLYYEKIVRVEPLYEDLERYAQISNFGIDTVRNDVIQAWKKWCSQNNE